MDNDKLNKLIFRVGNLKDEKAFSEIFDFFAPRIMGYLINSGSKKEIAEEITQEVLSTVWLKAIQFNFKKGNVSTWIFTITRNKKIDKMRRNENPSYNSLDLVEVLYQEENNEKKDLEDEIEKIQQNLTENERKLIKMNFFEGKTHKIISQDLEIPLGTVKSRIRKILLKMKKS